MKTALEEEGKKRDKALEMLNNNETELKKAHELKTTKASVFFFFTVSSFLFHSIHLHCWKIHPFLFVEAAERDTAEAEMHQALKALDHHQLQLDLAIEALKAASAEVAEAEDKKKMLEKEHGHLMAHLGRKYTY